MYAMAIRADGNLAVSLGPLGSVDARFVLLELINTKTGVVLLHPVRIRMTRSTKFRNLVAIDLALPACRPRHRLVGVITAGVAPMA
jgi:hypothetical protein